MLLWPTASTRTDRVRIVALDDDPVDLERLRRILRGAEEDLELATCHDEAALVEILGAREVDLVLLDYSLGAGDGLETLVRIRSAGWDGPVILLTGRGDEELAAEAFRSGVSDYMSKDVLSQSSLRRAIHNAVEKHDLRRALAQERIGLAKSVEELSVQNREIQSFYHSLSHELKTPLTSAREFIALVLDGVVGPVTDEAKGLLRKALRNCDQLVVAMNDILDVTRLETGKLEIHRSKTDLDPLIDLVLADHARSAEDRGLTLERGPGRATEPVWVDEKRVFQILSNLVGNAIKFTERGGRVAVDLGPDPARPGHWRIEVSDTGRGIPPDELRLIFERLYQTKHEDATIIGGLGIGLYLCRQLARLHDGEILVESEVGVGSRFGFVFPAARPTPAPAQRVQGVRK